ncbi:MAG: hypothetical protein HY208_09335 [Nitrospirae bacterium]|nr:hypothetical protein [Nitrospirota bacterium]
MRVGLLLLVALALPPGPALAENPLELDLRVGPAVPLADFADRADAGVFLSGTLFIHAGRTASFGLEAGGNLAHSRGSQDTSIFQLTPVIRLEAPLANKRGKGYLLLGAGYYQVDSESPATHIQHGDLGFNIGLGFLARVSRSVMAGFDLRYHHIVDSGSDLDYLVPGILLAFSP